MSCRQACASARHAGLWLLPGLEVSTRSLQQAPPRAVNVACHRLAAVCEELGEIALSEDYQDCTAGTACGSPCSCCVKPGGESGQLSDGIVTIVLLAHRNSQIQAAPMRLLNTLNPDWC